MSGSLGTKNAIPYSGVGLELYANTNNYFRYATNPSELDVRTQTFFLGSASPSNFISGSNGKLQISSSAFILTAEGSVTASSFIARSGSIVLFDTNNKYADAFNIGRIIYFDQTESSISDLSTTTNVATATNMSMFQTFILPGETAIGVSFTYKHFNADITTNSIRYDAYIQSASLGPITGTSGYGAFSTPEAISPAGGLDIGYAVPAGETRTGAHTFNLIISTNTILTKFWGKYVQIYFTAHSPSPTPAGTLHLKNFVYKSSRILASITSSYEDQFPPFESWPGGGIFE